MEPVQGVCGWLGGGGSHLTALTHRPHICALPDFASLARYMRLAHRIDFLERDLGRIASKVAANIVASLEKNRASVLEKIGGRCLHVCICSSLSPLLLTLCCSPCMLLTDEQTAKLRQLEKEAGDLQCTAQEAADMFTAMQLQTKAPKEPKEVGALCSVPCDLPCDL